MVLLKHCCVATLLLAVSLVLVKSWPIRLSGLTKSQKAAVEELRERVKDDLTDDFMMEDVYLLRWLTAKNFEVPKAEALLRENLRWRAEQKIDSILEQDWMRMNNEFPYQLETVDKQGRPILYFSFGDWDIRKLALSGMLPKLSRYFSKMFEEADMKVREMREAGSNVTQFQLIMNMDGYNIPQHACLVCLPFYTTLTQTMEARYPGTAEKAIFVNSPPVFETVLKLIMNVLSKQSRDTLKIYGMNRKQWETALLEFIDQDQFPRDL